jgi:ABC-2 type transport system permease protein
MSSAEMLPLPIAAVLRAEMVKQSRRPRTAGALLVVSAVVVTVCALVAGYRGQSPERIGDWGSVTPNSSGTALALVALNALTLLAYPVIACLYAGDTVAGEASTGSLRYLLATPTRRWRLLAAKIVTSLSLIALTVVVSGLAAFLIGLAVYGWHPLGVVDLQHSTAFNLASTVINPTQTVLLLLAALGVMLVSTAAVFAFAVLLSTLTEYSFAAIGGAIGLVFTSRALDNIPGLHGLSPWLPVTDSSTTAWAGLFDQPIHAGPITHLVIVQAVYIAGLLTVAFARFARADILS